MATLKELEDALIAADAAGNADDARELSAEIQRAQSVSDMSPPAMQASRPPMLSDKNVQRGRAGAILDGLFLGAGDEIAAGADAAIEGVSNLSWDKAKQTYGSTLAELRALEKQYGKERPVENIGLNIVGGIPLMAAGGAGVVSKAGMIPKIVQAAKTGAEVGGVAGFNSGEDGLTNRLINGGEGAVIGGTTAAVLPPMLNQGGKAVRGVAGLVTDTFAKRPSVVPADIPMRDARKGARYVAGLMRSTGVDDAALDAAGNGRGRMAAEVMGRPGTTALGALARRAGKTGDTLEGNLTERFASMPARMLDDFEQSSGIKSDAAQGNIEALVKTGREAASPLYTEALSKPPVITDRLNQFKDENIVQQGMRTGIKIQRLEALAKGEPFDPNAYAITDFNEAGDPVIGPVPTWKTWDAAKVGLDNMLDAYRDKTTGRVHLDKMGNAINEVRKSLLNELDGVNPAYKDARAKAGDYLGMQDAFQRGGDMLFNRNVTERQFSDTFARLTDADREAAKGGIANKLFNAAQNGQLKPAMLSSPRVKAKLEIALGKDKAANFMQGVQQEARMVMDSRRMKPGFGSPTAELNAAMAEQDGANGVMSNAVKYGMDAVQRGPIRAAISAAGNQLAKIPATGMRIPVRDEAGRLLMMQPDELAKYMREIGVGTRPFLRGVPLKRAIAPPQQP